ncbi:unnamed protein product [Amoebophrya sp. A120]|nr:unnamed protein product [Amoebophrya sp. A120]|eukprot:GSA120T00020035001.1
MRRHAMGLGGGGPAGRAARLVLLIGKPPNYPGGDGAASGAPSSSMVGPGGPLGPFLIFILGRAGASVYRGRAGPPSHRQGTRARSPTPVGLARGTVPASLINRADSAHARRPKAVSRLPQFVARGRARAALFAASTSSSSVIVCQHMGTDSL